MLWRTAGLAILAACAAWAEDIVHFEREFPGGIPELFAVKVTQGGHAQYSEGDEEPVDLQLGAAAVAPVFKRAAALKYFATDLASRRRVASTGRKVVRYESDGTVRGEATFDYSEVKEARELASWFVSLAETHQHLRELERVFQFDRLGVNQALVKLEQAVDRDRVVAPDLLVPILTKIKDQQRIVHLARARAEGLLERFREKNGKR